MGREKKEERKHGERETEKWPSVTVLTRITQIRKGRVDITESPPAHWPRGPSGACRFLFLAVVVIFNWSLGQFPCVECHACICCLCVTVVAKSTVLPSHLPILRCLQILRQLAGKRQWLTGVMQNTAAVCSRADDDFINTRPFSARYLTLALFFFPLAPL